MSKIMKRIAYMLAAAMLFACSPEEIHHPSEAEAPETASAYEPAITVDQETNQVTFALGEKAVVPVWVFQDSKGEWTEYHSGDSFKKIFAAAGDYTVRMYVMNAAGVTPDYVTKTFHIDNTIMNFDRYIRYIAGTDSKVWRIDNSVDAHQACGESVGNPTGWWAAKPDEKADFGLYDNRLSFTKAGEYTFDPGDAGTVYVNVGVTVAPYASPDETADFMFPVSAQTTTYEFGVEGNDLMLRFPEGTLFPYIPNNDFVKDVSFHVINLDANAMTLVWYTPTGNGGGPIAWQFILTSSAAEYVFNGYNYTADSNIWKPVDEEGGSSISYYYAPGWAQIADPALEHNGAAYTWSLPSATSDRWQAQIFIVPTEPITLSADKKYDFSCIFNSSADLTAKLKVHRWSMSDDKAVQDEDNGVILIDEDITLKAGEEKIFYKTALEGIDAPDNIRLVLDFGGCPDNTEITVSRITLKDNAVDDGTILPGDEPVDPVNPGGDYTYGDNLFDGSGTLETWFSGSDWSGGLDPQATFEGGKVSLTVPAVGGSEWMGQVKIHTNIPIEAGKMYDFSAKVTTSEAGVITGKLTAESDPGGKEFFYDGGISVEAGDNTVAKTELTIDLEGENFLVIFDFGRLPQDTEIEISDIVIREMSKGGSGPVEGDNLWAAAEVNYQYWYSAGDWSGALSPAEAEPLSGNGLRVVIPEGIGGSEWMGQNSIHAPGITASKDEKYDFWLTLEADDDVTVTVKLAWDGHDTTNEFFYDPNVSLKAGEPLKYQKLSIVTDPNAEERNDYEGIVLFVDAGRCPAGTELKLTDIHFQKHVDGGDEPVQPSEPDYTTNDPSIDPAIYKIDAATNLWRSTDISFSYWYSAADWSGQLAPVTFKADDWGGLKIIVPEGIGGNEWMGQSIWHTGIPASADGLYDFCFTVRSDEDIPAMTVKLAWEGNDGDHAFFYVNDASVKAGIKYQFRMEGIAPDVDYDKIVLFVDLGRAKAGTAVSFTDFCFQTNAAETP